MIDKNLADLRREYSLRELSRRSVDRDPLVQFSLWMSDAIAAAITDPNAMTIATVSSDCKPTARVVLLKAFGPDGFVFYTNYESAKGADLVANPNAVLHFFWRELERQVMIRGAVEKTSAEESKAYFLSRPIESRLSAWASDQSRELASRASLEERMEAVRKQYDGQEIPCPPYWGGYRLTPDLFEFWQGRKS